jgi:glucoamylase
MPLVWTHSEFLQLYVARHRGRAMDLLKSVEARYHGERPRASTWHWRADVPVASLPAARALVIEDQRPFTLHAGLDDWSKPVDQDAGPLGLGMFGVRFEPAMLAGKQRLLFSRKFADGWEGKDYEISMGKQGRGTRS